MQRFLVSTIQLLAALGVVGLCLYLELEGVDPKWIHAGGFTVFVFGFVAFKTREFWNNVRYWLLLLSLVIAHSVVVATVQLRHPALGTLYYGLFSFAEGACLLFLFLRIFA
jgi:hypothetical protein